MKRGFTIIELLVAVAVISVVVASLAGIAAFALDAGRLAKTSTEAEFLAEEALEAARSVRDNTAWASGLGAVSAGALYHPETAGSPPRWSLVAGAETLGNFTRQVVFDAVQRDPTTKNIITAGGTLDPDSKKVTASVSWPSRGATKTVTLVTYLTNWR